MPQPPTEFHAGEQTLRRCANWFYEIDMLVAREGAADGMAARVAGFPQLRVNRFLASYAGEALDATQFADWVQRLATLGSEAYRVELANLSPPARMQLAAAHERLIPGAPDAASAVATCTRRLVEADLASPLRRDELRAAVRVPDEYLAWQRVAGLYWLTRIPFAAGVRRWQEGVRTVFVQPLEALPARGELKRYAPPRGGLDAAAVAAVIEHASGNPLKIPEPAADELAALFATFAPEFEIDTVSDADRPGEPGWHGTAVRVDTSRPVVYTRISHARYADRVLLQLNYAVWFPERPADAGWKLLSGQLDGLIWRVTLSPEGVPWLFDSIHHCGCYHQFFPTALALPRPARRTLDETAFVPQTLPQVAPGTRVALRIAAGTHYLQRVILRRKPAAAAIEYRIADDDTLRSLPLPQGGHRSLFRPDGIVTGSERGERYWFWPMGVPEPGAMRQWGRHATAFVGRRHFDDARLLETYFEMTPP